MKRASRYPKTIQRVQSAENEQGIGYRSRNTDVLVTESKKDLELRTDCRNAETTMGVPIIAPEYRSI